jgi:hypothetical protein
VLFRSHAARRLEERFGLTKLKATPFSVHTVYCEATDIDRPVWAFRVGNDTTNGYLIGRWELANPQLSRGQYKHWFVATSVITESQFRHSRLVIRKSVKVHVKRVINELHSPKFSKPRENDTSMLTSEEESATM